MNLTVHIPDLDKLEAALKRMSPELRLEQRKAVSAAGGVLKDEVQKRIHSPGGHARKGIKVKVKGSGLNMEAKIVSGNRQAIFSQVSRSPGRTPPPMRAARAMARRYGIPKEKARALALSIAAKGTTGKPVMRDAFAAKKTQVVSMFRDALINVARQVKV